MSREIRKFNYVNDMGYNKQLVVYLDDAEDGKYECTLWSTDTGDLCGSGRLSKDQINDLLEHYGVPERI